MLVPHPAKSSLRLIRSIVAFPTVFAGLALFAPAQAQPLTPPELKSEAAASSLLEVSQLGFIQNLGQFDNGVEFQVKRSGLTTYLTSDAFCVAVPHVMEPGDFTRGQDIRLPEIDVSWVRFRFEGAEHVRPEGRDQEAAYANYFFGNDPSRWRRFVPSWSRVHYTGLYPGIDLDVRHTPDFEYDLELAPGADVGQVRIRVDGAQCLRLDEDGALCIETAFGVLRQLPPRSFVQKPDGTRRPISSRVVLLEESCFGFELPQRDPGLAVTIDPPLQLLKPRWFTYWGGSGADLVLDVAQGNGVASSSQVVATGATLEPRAGSTPVYIEQKNPLPSASHKGGWVVFVSRFNTTPKALSQSLLWSTFVGSSSMGQVSNSFDVGKGIDIDSENSVYVAGFTNTDPGRFPVTSGAFDATYGGAGGDAFTFKLSSNGAQLEYSTFLGGSLIDVAEDIKVDGFKNAYVTGWTDSAGPPYQPAGSEPYPTTPGAADAVVDSVHWAGFLTKLNPTGSALAWSTIIQGDVNIGLPNVKSFAVSLAVDPAVPTDIRPYVTGFIDMAGGGAGFPCSGNAWRNAPISGTSTECFVTGLTADGSARTYSSYFGGGGSSATNYLWDIAVLPDERLAVVGSTTSSSFPVQDALRIGGQNREGTISIFNPSAATGTESLTFSTLLGGSSDDELLAVAGDSASSLYVTGWTRSNNASFTGVFGNNLITAPSVWADRKGPQDALLFKLANDHSVVYGGFHGGGYTGGAWPGEEIGYAIEGNGSTVIIGGMTTSDDFQLYDPQFAPLYSYQPINYDGQSTYGTAGTFDGAPPDLHVVQSHMDGFVLRLDV